MKAMKFRKKPVVIEAILWTGTNFDDVSDFVQDTEIAYAGNNEVQIQTLEGVITAKAGDWIIRGVHGEYYPCKPDIFEKTYELAEFD